MIQFDQVWAELLRRADSVCWIALADYSEREMAWRAHVEARPFSEDLSLWHELKIADWAVENSWAVQKRYTLGDGPQPKLIPFAYIPNAVSPPYMAVPGWRPYSETRSPQEGLAR